MLRNTVKRGLVLSAAVIVLGFRICEGGEFFSSDEGARISILECLNGRPSHSTGALAHEHEHENENENENENEPRWH